MKIIDISWEIHEGMPVYPGNPEPKITQVAKIPEASSNLTKIDVGNHTGTHIDSPLHIHNDVPGTESVSLDSCYGQCKVLDLTNVEFGITDKDLGKCDIQAGDIVVCKTRNSDSSESFDEKFVHLTPEAADYLAKKRIKTIVVDYLSVQKFHAGSSVVHAAFLDNGITIFEGVRLKDVEPGEYLFIGLPLKIKGVEGAPARAILVKE